MATDSLVAIVTGGAGEIGRAICELLLQHGYKVCLVDSNGPKGNRTLDELEKKYDRERITLVECDVSSKVSFQEAFSRTQEKFGRIDLVINSATVMDEHDPELTVNVNMMGTIIGCQLALKFMGTSNGGKGGLVVNLSSLCGLISSDSSPVYTATKQGIIGLTRSYGSKRQFDQNGVTFATICPSYIKSATIEDINQKTLMPVTDEEMAIAIDPEFLAEGILKLVKEKVNGSVLMVIPGIHVYEDQQTDLMRALKS